MDEVSGSVDYDLEGQLSNGWQLVVELRDTSLQDAPSFPISRKTIDLNAAPPHSFQLKYNPQSVGERNSYSLQAYVQTEDEQLLFITDRDYGVITGGNPSRVNIDLVPTDLAESLIIHNEPLKEQTETTEPGSDLVETMPVNSRPEPSASPVEPTIESGGGGGVAFFLVLVVVIGFIAVLVARHRAIRPSEETEEEDFIDNQ